MGRYDAAYVGGHPALPKRLSHVILAIDESGVGLIERGGHRTPIPLGPESDVAFPHAMSSAVPWDATTQTFLARGSRSLVLSVTIDEHPCHVVLELRSNDDLPRVYCDMAWVLGDRRGAPTGPYLEVSSAHYVGGHPRFPRPSTRPLSVTVTPRDVCVWVDRSILFVVPMDTVQSVHTQYSVTSGKFFGLGAVGMVEASAAALLTRKQHHVVVMNAIIDQKTVGIVFNFDFEDSQLKVYQAIQTLLAQNTAAPVLGESSPSTLTIAEQLQAVAQLFRDNLLDAEEFRVAKQQILASAPTVRGAGEDIGEP